MYWMCLGWVAGGPYYIFKFSVSSCVPGGIALLKIGGYAALRLYRTEPMAVFVLTANEERVNFIQNAYHSISAMRRGLLGAK
jgi:hypothetical protein